MTVVDCWSSVCYSVDHLKDVSIKTFADKLAWDLINNPHPDKGTERGSAARSYIPADGTQEASNPLGMFCGLVNPSSEASSVSPLSSAWSSATSAFFNTGRVAHDPVKGLSQRKCVICSKNTQYTCKHPTCQAKVDKQNRTGTYICNITSKTGGKLPEVTCFEKHRRNVYSAAR